MLKGGLAHQSFAVSKSWKRLILFLLKEQTYYSWRQGKEKRWPISVSRWTVWESQTIDCLNFYATGVYLFHPYALTYPERSSETINFLPLKLFLPLKNRYSMWILFSSYNVFMHILDQTKELKESSYHFPRVTTLGHLFYCSRLFFAFISI